MSNDLFANSRHQQGASGDVHAHPLSPESDDLPLILARADEEQRSRLALKRMGYLKVRSAYLRYKRDGKETFHAFGAEHLWPTMEFVRDWLRQERRRLIVQSRPVFLVSLLATLVVGLAFLGAMALFG
jgi:hypothetical protein